jgi:hypothetical protein
MFLFLVVCVELIVAFIGLSVGRVFAGCNVTPRTLFHTGFFYLGYLLAGSFLSRWFSFSSHFNSIFHNNLTSSRFFLFHAPVYSSQPSYVHQTIHRLLEPPS